MKKLTLFSIATLALASLPALPSFAQVCDQGECVVTFEYTGSMVTWNVPADVDHLQFEVFGAAGGRGGLGGKVSGTLTNLPATLTIVVGGEGVVGSEAQGGYNGGGRAGGYRGNEGSGGGASDIRLGISVDSRILVAGGGGGGGGYAGADGAAGGGLIANAGGSGQGAGGQGGTQSSGGSGGSSNGGSSASSGGFGFGGYGGSSWNAGGGGGGGGWYGGGGGGADDNSCCSDGGGGGGGSSFARQSYTQSVSHEVGVRSGHGLIVIRFTEPLSVVSFGGSQLDSDSLRFDLELSRAHSLALSDFDLSLLGCETTELTGSGVSYQLLGSNCQAGDQQVLLPSLSTQALLTFDKSAPELILGEPILDQNLASYTLPYTLSESELTQDHILIDGCSEVALKPDSIVLTGCADGPGSLSVLAGAVSDSFGNSAPGEDQVFSFAFDLVAPSATFSEFSFDAEVNSYRLNLDFSEASTVLIEPIFQSTMECTTSMELIETGMLLGANCGYGSGDWILEAFSLSDSAGNLGPEQAVVFSFDNPEPPAPEPTEAVQAQPEEPLESPAQSQSISQDVVYAEPAPIPIDPAPTPIEETEPEPVASEPVQEELSDLIAELIEQIESEEPLPEPEVVIETLPITEAVSEPAPVVEPVEEEATTEPIAQEPEQTATSEVVPEELFVSESIAPAVVQVAAATDAEESNLMPQFLIGTLAALGVTGALLWRFSGR